MINIAPLDYERYLALVGPFPLTETVAKYVSPARHTEELTQISERMDLWHEFSAEGELERVRLAQQGGRSATRVPDMPPAHARPFAKLVRSAVIEAAGDMNIGGEVLYTPPLRVAANLYRPVIDAHPPAISETA